MDGFDAVGKCGRMWRRLGLAFEREAYARAKKMTGMDREQALNAAKAAEVCYWQATGDADSIQWEDLKNG